MRLRLQADWSDRWQIGLGSTIPEQDIVSGTPRLAQIAPGAQIMTLTRSLCVMADSLIPRTILAPSFGFRNPRPIRKPPFLVPALTMMAREIKMELGQKLP
jgi:hypothetical protein